MGGNRRKGGSERANRLNGQEGKSVYRRGKRPAAQRMQKEKTDSVERGKGQWDNTEYRVVEKIGEGGRQPHTNEGKHFDEGLLATGRNIPGWQT